MGEVLLKRAGRGSSCSGGFNCDGMDLVSVPMVAGVARIQNSETANYCHGSTG